MGLEDIDNLQSIRINIMIAKRCQNAWATVYQLANLSPSAAHRPPSERSSSTYGCQSPAVIASPSNVRHRRACTASSSATRGRASGGMSARRNAASIAVSGVRAISAWYTAQKSCSPTCRSTTNGGTSGDPIL
jgi:hypothetical protein